MRSRTVITHPQLFVYIYIISNNYHLSLNMVKKNTNEHDYFKNIKDFLTYHFNKTPGNETKLANVLEYCKLTGRVLGKMK